MDSAPVNSLRESREFSCSCRRRDISYDPLTVSNNFDAIYRGGFKGNLEIRGL